MKMELKKKCTIINKLFEKPNFFKTLCQFSNNDIEEVINNINLIINYYLTTKDTNNNYELNELLTIAIQTPINEEIIIHPANSYDELHYILSGINGINLVQYSNEKELEKLNQLVSFNNNTYPFFYVPITSNIKDAINLSHISPHIIYKSILKQPSKKELPIVVGATETRYYQSILDIRLKNTNTTYRKTTAKKILKKYIGKDSLLVVFPKQTKHYTITDKDLSKQKTTTYIPNKYLGFIKIPSRYKLLSLCAYNKKIHNGELIDINTGELYKRATIEEPPTYHIYYSRYELLEVTSEFEYLNSELTQDINYDIDLIYGNLDTNYSRKKVKKDPYQNIDFIKRSSDIHLRKIKGKYYIRNGRHRLLYLKHFYVSNYESYKAKNQINELKQLMTIPVSIERAIENLSVNKLLSNIKEISYDSTFIKTNINNDKIELLIIFKNRTYIINNETELNELYNLLILSNLNNKYFIGYNSNKHNIDYEELMDYLIISLKEKIYDMSLKEIIEYITHQGFYQENQYFLTSNLNYLSLTNEYIELQHYINIRNIFKKEIDIIDKTQNKILKKQIGKQLISFITSNPILKELEWNDLYLILSTIPEFQKYSSDYLESAANLVGYQKESITNYKDEIYTKKKIL